MPAPSPFNFCFDFLTARKTKICWETTTTCEPHARERGTSERGCLLLIWTPGKEYKAEIPFPRLVPSKNALRKPRKPNFCRRKRRFFAKTRERKAFFSTKYEPVLYFPRNTLKLERRISISWTREQTCILRTGRISNWAWASSTRRERPSRSRAWEAGRQRISRCGIESLKATNKSTGKQKYFPSGAIRASPSLLLWLSFPLAFNGTAVRHLLILLKLPA